MVTFVALGSAAAAVAKMAFGNKFGFTFATTDADVLYTPICGSFVAEVEADFNIDGAEIIELGKTTANDYFELGTEKASVELTELLNFHIPMKI